MWLTFRSTRHKYFCIKWSCKYGVSDKTVKALWFDQVGNKAFEKKIYLNYRYWSGNHFWRTLVDSSFWMAIVIRGTWNTATGYRTDRRKIWFTAPSFFPAPARLSIFGDTFLQMIFSALERTAFPPPSKVHPVWFLGNFNLSVGRDVTGWKDTYKQFGQLTRRVVAVSQRLDTAQTIEIRSSAPDMYRIPKCVLLCVCVYVRASGPFTRFSLVQNYTQRRL